MNPLPSKTTYRLTTIVPLAESTENIGALSRRGSLACKIYIITKPDFNNCTYCKHLIATQRNSYDIVSFMNLSNNTSEGCLKGP